MMNATRDKAFSDQNAQKEESTSQYRSSSSLEKEQVSSTIDAHDDPSRTPYSRFTRWQKRLIVLLIAFAATFSPLSSFIFFRAITALSSSLAVSAEKINLTGISYMIVSGIAPALMGDIADMTGRRLVYLLMFTIYLAANIGLAVQSSWTALFLLRMLQSAGGVGALSCDRR